MEEEPDNAYVSGLRQLLENLDPLIRQTNSAGAIEDILLNLETTDENFHKYDLVRRLRRHIESELGQTVHHLVQEGDPEISNHDLTSTLHAEVLSSDTFNNITQTTVTAIKSAANEIIQSLSDTSTNPSFGFTSSDRPTRFSHGGPDSCGEDSFLTSSFDGDDFMFMSPEKYSMLAKQLSAESSLTKKIEALDTLSQIPQTDLVNSEFWSTIKTGLLAALKADQFVLSDKSLKFHAKMFATPSGHVTKEIFTSLSSHLIDYFKDSTSHMVVIESGLDLGDKRNIKLLKEFRLLNQFQHELPLCWVRYPEKLVDEILKSTVNLMCIVPQSISTNKNQVILGPLNFLSLIDPSAFWFCKWMHGNYSRAELIKHLSEAKYVLKEACKSCIDFALNCKVQSTMTLDEEALDDDADSLIFSKAELLCAYFIQSISILGRIILYKEGRKIFPLELEDRLETITIPDLLVSFVEVISFMPLQGDAEVSSVDIEPAKLAAEILKSLASGTADTCIDCICKDAVTSALLVPVQRWLDGYIGLDDNDIKTNESTLILTADVLAVIAATEFGRIQLLYGEKPVRWQRTRLAPIHTIALFTKNSLAGKLDPKPSQKVTSAFLFVCRQLYNTCEGLSILNSYCLSIYIKAALEDLRKSSDNTGSEERSEKQCLSSISDNEWQRALSISSSTTENGTDSTITQLGVKIAAESAQKNSLLIIESESEEDAFVEEDMLVEFSRSVMKPTPKIELHVDHLDYVESLIDNLLNFMSTPKGVSLVQQSGLMVECAQYMNNRYQQNLQVSKTEKFGYGVMMTQITATAPGMLAVEKAGFFKTLLQNTWDCLEGVSNDFKETVLTPYWDDFSEKNCRKYFTTLVNLLSAFTSVYELLNLHSVSEEESMPNVFVTNDPVTSENAPKCPENFPELLANLVFIDGAEKMRLLFHFERSHLFGLRVLSSMVTCLDTFLLLQSKYGFQEILLRIQEGNKLEDGTHIIDNCSVERNQILVRTYLIGGPTERIIPPRDLTADPENPYPWPLFSSYPVPPQYSPHESSLVITAFEQQDEICKFLAETASESLNSLVEARDWLSRCRAVFVSSIKKGSEMVGLKSASQLLERVCFALCQDPEECIFPLVEYSGNETLLQNVPLSDIDQLGVELVVRYGIGLRLIPHASDVDKQFKHFLRQCKYFLSSQQCSIESSMQSLQNGYSGFDWFLSSIYLVMNGKTEKAWDFLYRFSTLVASGYIWTARLHASIHLPKELNESGIHCIYSSVCHNLELILQAEIPQIYSAFRMSGYPPSQICQHWLKQCFWNCLDWSEICWYLCCCLLMGIDYQIYFCLAVLKHLQKDIFLHTQRRDLAVFLKEEPIRDFKVGRYIDFMITLQNKYRAVILPDIQDITKP